QPDAAEGSVLQVRRDRALHRQTGDPFEHRSRARHLAPAVGTARQMTLEHPPATGGELAVHGCYHPALGSSTPHDRFLQSEILAEAPLESLRCAKEKL